MNVLIEKFAINGRDLDDILEPKQYPIEDERFGDTELDELDDVDDEEYDRLYGDSREPDWGFIQGRF